MKIGKKPARPGSVKLRLRDYLNYKALPVPPASFDYSSRLPADVGMLGNDSVGDCTCADADHVVMIWRALAGSLPATFSAANALADYSAITGYDPADPATDQGADMQQVASYRLKTGMIDVAGIRHKVGAYVAIAPGDVATVALAAWMFGAVDIGIAVSSAQIDQFNKNQPWSGALAADAGGHAVPVVGTTAAGQLVVLTWGRRQLVDPAFFRANNDENIVCLSRESIKGGLGPTGVNVAQLDVDLLAMQSAPPPPDTYVVIPGDTLYGIARSFGGITAGSIAALNKIAPPYVIHPGQQLRLT
jgi:hypothetical protein